jgi:hypothetical protein
MFVNGAGGFDFVTVSSQAAVTAAAAGDNAAKVTFIYDNSTGHLYVDGNGGGLSTAGAHDMEISLVGIPHITSANIVMA